MKTVQQLMNLKGRVAVVTGGAGHLGYVLAEALAEAGANIVLWDICPEAKTRAVKMAKRYHVRALGITSNLADDDDISSAVGEIAGHFSKVDILVHCAALVGTSGLDGWAVSFEQQSVGTWRKALEVNLTSVFTVTQKLLPLLKKSKVPSVINISSIYGMVGPDLGLYEGTKMGNPAAYAASKGGLIQLTRWLATNLAPKVRVNTISLGGIYRGHKDPFLTRYLKRTPLKRMASEQDIKGALVYLASDMSGYVTGHNLVVDGGWTAW
jgi:NAD(P)-dependent dehydrogenase (short-subunit alcohol dehydrogenase family)